MPVKERKRAVALRDDAAVADLKAIEAAVEPMDLAQFPSEPPEPAPVAKRVNGKAVPKADNVARIAGDYDTIPYNSHPFPESQPERVAAVAQLFGFTPPGIASARVLEIGAAAGGNIIPHAARYSDARFIGIDISRVQVAQAKSRIKRLGLENIAVLRQSVGDLDQGEFDYIICHGVYSWVPPDVQRDILRCCQERLAPNGIAYVSYNVLPGWRQWQVVRDTLMTLVEGAPLAERPAQARAFLNYLAEHTPDGTTQGQMFREQAARLATLPDDYLAHEHLSSFNDPCTFTDFVRAAGEHELAFLAEAEPALMLPETWLGTAAPGLRHLAGDSVTRTEQAIDIMTGRTFRRSLLIHSKATDTLRRKMEPEHFADFHFIAPFALGPIVGDDLATEQRRFGLPNGGSLTTMRASVGEAIERLIMRLPASSMLDDLLAGSSDPEERLELLDALMKMVLAGLCSIAIEPVRCSSTLGDQPIASPLARDAASIGMGFAPTQRHENLPLDPIAQQLLPLLDGETPLSGLHAAISRAVAADKVHFQRAGVPITNAVEIETCVAEHIGRVLELARAGGLLIAPALDER